MKWFKCIDPDNPVIFECEDHIGEAGTWQAIKIVKKAIQLEITELDAKTTKRLGNLKIDRANKILPFAQKILNEALKILGKSDAKLSQNLSKSGANVEQNYSKTKDFDTSNPVIEEPLIEERRIDKNRREITPFVVSPKGKKAIKPKATRLSSDWYPSDGLKEWAIQERKDIDIETVIQSFVDYWVSKPGQLALKLDWDRTFKNWIRKEKPGRTPVPQSINEKFADVTETHEVIL